MIHSRRFKIKHYDDLDELAHDLTRRTWTLCSGFEYQGVQFLNDSFSEDGAGEFAAVIQRDGQDVQVESLTFSWMKPEEAKQAILECVQYARGEAEPPMYLSLAVALHAEGSCGFCA